MLTARGFWFFITALALLAVAVITAATMLVLLSLTLLLWFLVGWFLFQWRLRAVQRGLAVERELRTGHGLAETLWAEQRVQVQLKLVCLRSLTLPYVVLTDRVPELAQMVQGWPQTDGSLEPAEPLVLSYEVECPAAGRLRFEGAKVQLADLHGFFTQALFVRDVRTYRVLPALALKASHPTFVKQQNALPMQGKHRHPRAGSGSELFDLREYQEGDPPKMIAWKVSARRDRLMTRELESEVPIRCTLFVDTSDAVRAGRAGQSPLGRLVEIATGVALANTAERDLTGLCLFDEQGVRKLLRPGRGSRHYLQLIDALTDAASRMPEPRQVVLTELLAYGYGLAQEVYPDLLQADVNSMPWWLPFWAPQPYYTIPQPPLTAGSVWSLPWVWLKRLIRESPIHLRRLRRFRFSPFYHREYRWRKQLAALLSVRYGLTPGGLGLLLEDDEACGHYLKQFLAEHQVTYPFPLYDEAGRYLFASPRKVEALANALLAAVTRGKDNELFVLLVDLLESGPELEKVERAVSLARARHHQVMVICPWPEDVPLPPKAGGGSRRSRLPKPTMDWKDLLSHASTTRLHQAFARVQQAFGRFGIPVICAAADDTAELILHQLQRLRVYERGFR